MNERSIENTPSIYFHFEDSHQKTQTSKEIFSLEYSQNTNQENDVQLRQDPMQIPVIISPCKNEGSPIKTEDFFTEFDNNFIVTFDDELPADQYQHFERALHSRDYNSHIVAAPENTVEPLQQQKNSSQLNPSALSLESLRPQKDKLVYLNAEENFSKNKKPEIISQKMNLQNKKPVESKNLQILGQKLIYRKTTKKRVFANKASQISKECVSLAQPRKQMKQCISLSWKRCNGQRQWDQLKHLNILSTHNRFRETLKSTTLDHWRKKHLSKQLCQRKTVKREIIPYKPFLIR